ncbi:KRR1 small subunit processome component homolog [Quercus lobata]|uniref:KRR1 small subunit processome component homolog n=1 Tax=Quercus lobata TaxID=97700 RepID=UPI001243D9AC|nr:KRR1 small subunit processome component homolog [Quercus lobata]
MEHENNRDISQQPKMKHKGKHDKPKPWDDDPNIDRWKIEKFDLSRNETGMLEVSGFQLLCAEKYLQEVWPTVNSSLKEYGISCELNLVEGSLTVSTTRKTRDPYIIINARDLIKLLSRSFPVHQAIKILDDEMQCDIIKTGNLVHNRVCYRCQYLTCQISPVYSLSTINLLVPFLIALYSIFVWKFD